MTRLDTFSDKAMELAGQVGDSLKHVVPAGAGKWLQTGAALSMAKTGTRVAGKLVRRNPTLAVAAAAGAGLLWYMARRQQKKAQNGAIEGKATRIEAKRATKPTRKRAAAKRTRKSSNSDS
ncbi:hypothetical protein [Luteimonas vadosa]|uniref:DUF3618 domain-containing protein n=1 Tax=Luteimonas vadosa TaxID=1165507 RepID=A0ABP9DSD5_9GAMM